jgi:pimeloyl-ACP methyl ester carboxylesterase
MSFASSHDTRLYFESTGSGFPIIFVHELAGDHRSWEPQVRFFSRNYQCITFNARGYPPSDVPEKQEAYNQGQAADDIAAVLDHLKIEQAHVVGLSMGAFATVHFGLRHKRRASSLTIVGGGAGSPASDREQFTQGALSMAEAFSRSLEDGMNALASSSIRDAFKRKDPRGWQQFYDHMLDHSALGSEMTLKGCLARRPSLSDFKKELATVDVPTFLVVGDEDVPCINASLFLRQTMPNAALWIVPRTGHSVNLEEPEAFNMQLLQFFTAAEKSTWL